MKPNKDLLTYFKSIGLEVKEKKDCSPNDSLFRLTNVMKDDKKIQKQKIKHLENLRKV